MKTLIIFVIACSLLIPTAFAASDVTIKTDTDSYEHGEVVKITGETSADIISIQIKEPTGKTVLIRNIDAGGSFELDFNLPSNFNLGEYEIVASVVIDGIPQITSTSINLTGERESLPIVSEEQQVSQTFYLIVNEV